MNTVTPKKRFLLSQERTKTWNSFVEREEFIQAVETALLQYQVTLAPNSLADGASVAYQIKGAKEFANVLLNLGVADVARKQSDSMALEDPSQIGSAHPFQAIHKP